MEGLPASQLVQLIRFLGHNTDVTFELATVVAAPPELSIQIDNMSVTLEKDDLIVVESLTKHEKKIKLTSTGKVTLSKSAIVGFGKTGEYGDNKIPLHKHDITSIKMSNSDLTVNEAMLEYLHELKKDDRVLVAGINKGQTYIVLDRLITY